jgi:acyl carrier protein
MTISRSFLKMTTMEQTDNLTKVMGEFRTVFKNKGLDPPDLSVQTRLDGSLGLESLDFAEIVMRLEQVFGKDPFSNGSIPEISTLGDLCSLY